MQSIENKTNSLEGVVTGVITGEFGSFYIHESNTDIARMARFSELVGYRGQPIREIGLLPGRQVHFTVETNGSIGSVDFPFEDSYKRILGRWKLPFQDFFDNMRAKPPFGLE